MRRSGALGPAMQPCDCWTWWNHNDGRYSISPAFTLQCSGRARLYCGYRSRSGSRGSRGIHGTWEGGWGVRVGCSGSTGRNNRHLKAPSQSRSDRRPRTRRRPADGKRLAGTALTDKQVVILSGDREVAMVTAGLLWIPYGMKGRSVGGSRMKFFSPEITQ